MGQHHVNERVHAAAVPDFKGKRSDRSQGLYKEYALQTFKAGKEPIKRCGRLPTDTLIRLCMVEATVHTAFTEQGMQE